VRLVAEIEKLIKNKIELEPMEFEEDRPRGRINDGRRHWREEGREGEAGDARDVLDTLEPPPRERAGGTVSGARGNLRPHRGPAASRDPFFEKPYEPPQREAEPDWEAAAKAAPSVRGISANIKSKRKIPALFRADAPIVQSN
jgi:ATP-dependent RNA helicase RhlE